MILFLIQPHMPWKELRQTLDNWQFLLKLHQLTDRRLQHCFVFLEIIFHLNLWQVFPACSHQRILLIQNLLRCLPPPSSSSSSSCVSWRPVVWCAESQNSDWAQETSEPTMQPSIRYSYYNWTQASALYLTTDRPKHLSQQLSYFALFEG